MPNLPSSNSHDGFFKTLFGQQEYARSFLTSTLPSDLVRCLDLSTLEPSSASFVDEQLRQAHSDLLFRTRLADGSEAAIYLLFEHKSVADRLTVFQVLRYILKINEQRLRDHQELCCVIPIVVYHGANPWNAPRSLRQLIQVPAPLEPFIPDFSLQIMDLSQIEDSEFRGDAFFCASIMIFKYIMRSDIVDRLGGIFQQLSLAGLWQQTDAVMLLLNYLVSGTDRVSPEILQQELTKAVSTHRKSLMPTLAEIWVQQGHEAGMLRGTLSGRIQMLQEYLRESPASAEQLRNLDLPQLIDLEQSLRSRLNLPAHADEATGEQPGGSPTSKSR
jgi:hypothetical protein